jgi:pyruvate kinase
MRRRHRHAKIVATLAPASSEPAVIRALLEAGADVFQLNFSHGDHADRRERHARLEGMLQAGREGWA